MALKTATPTAPAGMLAGLAPEFVDPPKGQRSTKYAAADIDAALELLGRTYESGQAAKFTLKDEDAVKILVNLFRHVTLTSGGGVSLKVEGNVLYVKGKVRKNRVEGKPRKPRATKGQDGTPEYLARMAQYEIDIAEWNAAQTS